MEIEESPVGLNGWDDGGVDLSVLTGEAVAMTSLRKMDIGLPPADIE